MARRVALERAAWQLAHGAAVTDAAFAAGYDSVASPARSPAPTGTCRARFPRVDGGRGASLPAPNGMHVHTPDGL
jgi:AraC family transcriptional regulator